MPDSVTTAPPLCRALWLGRVEYEEALRLQRQTALLRARGAAPDTLLLLEHPPVYTTGRRGAGGNLRAPAGELGAPLVAADRGGEITFHGPGQLIAYAIIDLRAAGLGAAAYVQRLEETVIGTLADWGIQARREPGLVGVWAQRSGAAAPEKIAAIGVRVSRPAGPGSPRVTGHGLALNVSVELAWFRPIVPCGIADRGVTSMAALLGQAPPLAEVARRLAGHFGRVFGRRIAWGEGSTPPATGAGQATGARGWPPSP